MCSEFNLQLKHAVFFSNTLQRQDCSYRKASWARSVLNDHAPVVGIFEEIIGSNFSSRDGKRYSGWRILIDTESNVVISSSILRHGSKFYVEILMRRTAKTEQMEFIITLLSDSTVRKLNMDLLARLICLIQTNRTCSTVEQTSIKICMEIFALLNLVPRIKVDAWPDCWALPIWLDRNFNLVRLVWSSTFHPGLRQFLIAPRTIGRCVIDATTDWICSDLLQW